MPPLWHFPHHRYCGMVVTVGAMVGVACAEWNVHAGTCDVRETMLHLFGRDPGWPA